MKPLTFCLLACWLVCLSPLCAQSQLTQETANRYEQMLLKSPENSSAFEQVAEWYSTQGGGLEVLQKRWRVAAEENEELRSSYLILQGMLAERLRAVSEAREFYQKALESGADPATAARLLAVLETTEGNFPAAVQHYEAALQSENLPPLSAMDLMRALALLHQRAFDDARAVQVWRQAIEKFGDDPYVLEEAGEAFLSAGEYDEARKTFLRLQSMSDRDPFRRVAVALRLARVEEVAGNMDQAIATYERLLAETSEGSWINREVRGRAEELFRRKDDLPGLLAFYENRSKSAPQDFLALAAQAAVLDELGKSEEALQRLRQAVALAPDRVDLRLNLIRALQRTDDTDSALQEARELARASDPPLEVLLLLGNLQWAQFERSQNSVDREAAVTTWKRIAPEASKDVARMAQAAEVFAARGLTGEAASLWLRIIAEAPGASDARQRLAEQYLKQQNPEAAEKILTGMVEEERALPENFLALARIQERLEMNDSAKQTVTWGVELFPTDFDLLQMAWRQAVESQKREKADLLFARIWQNAPNAYFAADAVKRQVAWLVESGRSIDTQTILLERAKAGDFAAWEAALFFRLALEARDEASAKLAIEKQADPVEAARSHVELAQALGTHEDQITALRKLAELEPRMVQESLLQLAQVQAQAGQIDEALQTAEELIRRSPAESTPYRLYADLASAAGRTEAAVSQLRQGIRYTDNASDLRLQLADLLQAQGRFEDAIQAIQDAFEAEKQEGRRFDLFRRQIEMARQTGRIEALVASLRERQAKEKDGGRYGSYLAEIYLQQNDFQSAYEELTKTLGRNPQDTSAVRKLMDLADRSGDPSEGLRLAERLLELQNTVENRAEVVKRLLQTGDLERAMLVLDQSRPEILQDPAPWRDVLFSMRQSGLSDQFNALVQEMTFAPESDSSRQLEVARMLLAQGNFSQAEEVLWKLVGRKGLGEAIINVSQEAPNPHFFMAANAYWNRIQGLHVLLNEEQMRLQQMFQNAGRMRFFNPSRRGQASFKKATIEQRDQVSALFTLWLLSRAQQQDDRFFSGLDKIFAEEKIGIEPQILIQLITGNSAAIERLVAKQAENPEADIQMDRLLLGVPSVIGQGSYADNIKIIQKRVAAKDPQQAFVNELNTLASEFGKAPQELSPEERNNSRDKLVKLLNHPGRSEERTFQLVDLALRVGDYELASDLMQKMSQNAVKHPALRHQDQNLQAMLVFRAIQDNDPNARKYWDQFMKINRNLQRGGRGVGPTAFIGSYGSGHSPLAAESSDLTVGDSRLLLPTFRSITQFSGPNGQNDKVRSWFASQEKDKNFPEAEVVLFYTDWLSDKKEQAVERLESLQIQNACPQRAALLLEAYEKLNAHDKALAILDVAELQEGETPAVRNLRKIRLLRKSRQIKEARSAAESLARGRVSTEVRQFLAQELQQLGVPATVYQSLAGPLFRRPQINRPTQSLSQRISTLQKENRTDEVERLAIQVLQQPFPGSQDHNRIGQRSSALQALQSIQRLDRYESKLQERLLENPEDEAALARLIEAALLTDKIDAGMSRLTKAVQDNPQSLKNLVYLMRQVQRSSQDGCVEIISSLMQTAPDHPFFSEFSMQEIFQLASQGKNTAVLALTLAGLDDETYNKLFLPTRLSGQANESGILLQMAEAAVQAGKPNDAITLLQRTPVVLSHDPNQFIVSRIRLVELLLANGKKDKATSQMQELLDPKASLWSGIFGISEGGIGNWIWNMSVNLHMQRAGNFQSQILRIGKLAQETGTFELLLSALEKGQSSGQTVSPSLILRTALGRSDVGEEWSKIIMSEKLPAEILNLPMLTTIVTNVADQKDAARLIPALLKKFPVSHLIQGHGQEVVMHLQAVLPVLGSYRNNTSVRSYLANVVAAVGQSPHGQSYLLHTPEYAASIQELIELGFVKEARQLLDFTSSDRAIRNYGNSQVFSGIETRLALLEGAEIELQVLCAAEPSEVLRTRIHWKVAPTPKGNEDIRRYSQNLGVIWDNSNLSLSGKLVPRKVEIYAGANPGNMRKVAESKKPEAQGTVDVELPAALGLLQARVEDSSGEIRWGPLSAYVIGQNLISDAGVPKPSNEIADGFLLNQAGPLGKNAVVREGISASQTENIPLATVSLQKRAGALVFVGWLNSGSSTSNPYLEVTTKEKGGRANNRSYHTAQIPMPLWGQLTQMWSDSSRQFGGEQLNNNADQLELALKLLSSHGFNYGQWKISAAWDGVQLVWIPAEELPSDKIQETLQMAKQFARTKDFSGAVDAYLKVFRSNPSLVFQQNPKEVFSVFLQAKRLKDLWIMVSMPSLYVSNPLNQNRPTLQSSPWIDVLVDEALADSAAAEAKLWLKNMESISLSESMQFSFDAAILLRQAQPASVEKTLEVLGFKNEIAGNSRLASIWQFSSNPRTEPVLQLLDTPEKRQEALGLLEQINFPPNYALAGLMARAWLEAIDRPEKALELWKQFGSMRRSGPNSVSYDDVMQRAFWQRIAQSHPKPQDVVAVLQETLAQNYPDPAYQQRLRLEGLYRLAQSQGPSQAEYRKIWAALELAALQSADYQSSHERVRELAAFYLATQNWELIGNLIDSASKNRSLQNDPVMREFDQLRNRVAFARGELDTAWPVSWVGAKGGEDGTRTIYWQWNIRQSALSAQKTDVAIAVAEEPILSTIPQQKRIEVFFGEVPGEMKVIAEVQGVEAAGSSEVKLPSENGFLRVEAVFPEKRIAGPLFPVLSGKRVFPTEDSTWEALLYSGPEPLPPDSVKAMGGAPDGSPSWQIGRPGGSGRLKYFGPDFPVEPGKFYVSRIWVRRVGDGQFSNGTEYMHANKVGRPLLMVMATGREATGQWVCYTRAVPTLPQHTFWIPYQKARLAAPTFSNANSGTELAGWELLEISDWKYGDWIRELALLREEKGQNLSKEELSRALQLAAYDPLTALDYHGAWLADQAVNHGQVESYLSLWDEAMWATPNPLVPLPKMGRIYNGVDSIIRNDQTPAALKWSALTLALKHGDRLSDTRVLSLQRRLAELASSHQEGSQVLAAMRQEWRDKLGNAELAKAALQTAARARSHNNGKPESDFLMLLRQLNDDVLIAEWMKGIEGEPGTALKAWERVFMPMVLEMAKSEGRMKPEWKDQCERGFSYTENDQSPGDYLFWPGILSCQLAEKSEGKELALELRRLMFQRARQTAPADTTALVECVRSGWLLIKSAQEQGISELTGETVQQVAELIQKYNRPIGLAGLDLVLLLLAELSSQEHQATLYKVVKKDAESSPEAKEKFARYAQP